MRRFHQPYQYGIRAKVGESLTIDEIRKHVPSVFADHAHDSRSSRYVYISSLEVMESLMSEGFMPVEAKQGRADEDHRGFAKHLVRFRKNGERAKIVGDVSFEVIMRNAHDGSSTYQFLAGLFRLICLNGMTVDEGTVAAVRVRHSGDSNKIIDEVVKGAHAVVDQADVVLEAPQKWSRIMLSQADKVTLADSARIARFGDAEGNVDTPITAEQLLIPRRPADQGDDLWRTFNVLQENVTRGGITAMGEHRRVTTREVHGINQDIRLNQELWYLADTMAKLKVAA